LYAVSCRDRPLSPTKPDHFNCSEDGGIKVLSKIQKNASTGGWDSLNSPAANLTASQFTNLAFRVDATPPGIGQFTPPGWLCHFGAMW
jgi:hypothetical protein